MFHTDRQTDEHTQIHIDTELLKTIMANKYFPF